MDDQGPTLTRAKVTRRNPNPLPAQACSTGSKGLPAVQDYPSARPSEPTPAVPAKTGHWSSSATADNNSSSAGHHLGHSDLCQRHTRRWLLASSHEGSTVTHSRTRESRDPLSIQLPGIHGPQSSAPRGLQYARSWPGNIDMGTPP